jgi:hypothetical protein
VNAAVAAGSTFAVAVLLGFGCGLMLAHRTGEGFWAIVGLFAGVLLGGAAAVRALLQAGK